MKSVESKTPASQTKPDSPFFQKRSDQSFIRPGRSDSPFFPKFSSQVSPIQTKLTVGQPNDIYEKEADATADKIVQRMSEPAAAPPPSVTPLTNASFVQEKCAHCEQEDQLQMKPIFESEGEIPEGGVQRKCAACEQEEKQVQKKPDASPPQSVSPQLEHSLNASRGSGSSLPRETREKMETSFGADFSGVRIHNDDSSVRMSKDLNAQAFTRGNDIYFNTGKYDIKSKGGQHLLAHELTHTLQQGGNEGKAPSPDHTLSPAIQRQDDDPQPTTDPPPAVDPQTQADPQSATTAPSSADPDAAVAEDLQKEKDEARAGASQDTDLMLRASATRLLLLLIWRTHPPLKTKDDLDAFVAENKKLAETEISTLGEFGPAAAELAMASNAKGFPLTWSGRIQSALTLGADAYTLVIEWAKSLLDLKLLSQGLGPEIFAHGLPLSSSELSRADGFQLRISDANAQNPSAVRDYAQASIKYMQLKWISLFAFTWENTVDQIASNVADGTLVPVYTDWKDFVDNKQALLRDLPERARTRLAQTEDDAQKIQTDALHLSDASIFVGMTSALYSIFGILSGWNDASGIFDDALKSADGMVAGAGNGDKIIAALQWAKDNGYFGAAAAAWVQNLINNGPQILAEIAVIIILGMIPGVDIAVALYLAFTTARDVLGMLDELAAALNDVMQAKSVSELQKASNRLAVILTNGAISILIVLVTEGVGWAAAKIKTRAAELMAKDATLTREAAEKRALEELSPEERSALEEGPAKLAAKFKEFDGACALGSINCRFKLPDKVVEEAGEYPKDSNVPMPPGPYKVQKAILSGVKRGTENLRDIARKNRSMWPEFDKALAKAEKAGSNWPLDANGDPWEVHHTKPVFMGGDNKPENLFPLPNATHQKFTNWWNAVHRAFKKRFTPEEWDEIYSSDKDVPGSKVPQNPK